MNLFPLTRSIALISIATFIILRKAFRKKKNGTTENDTFENFEKDVNGLYPWEKNTDCSPTTIPPDAVVFKQKNKIRRGHW